MIKKQREAAIKPGIYEIAVNGLFTALIAVGAFIKISIPVQPFPMNFTLQFFFVLLAGLLLGGKQAFFCVLTYLAVGHAQECRYSQQGEALLICCVPPLGSFWDLQRLPG